MPCPTNALYGVLGAPQAVLIPDPGPPPVLYEIAVPTAYDAGALLHVLYASATYSITGDGVGIRANGEVYISDKEAFTAALPQSAVVSVSGVPSATLSFTAMPDIHDLADYAQNAFVWFDAADNRQLTVSNGTGLVEEFRCKVDPARVARNDPYPTGRPAYASSGLLGSDKPAIRFAPAAVGSSYGLFFPDSPLFAGMQRLTFSNASTMGTRWDNKYSPNVLDQPTASFPDIDLGDFVATGKAVVLSAVFTQAGSVTFRLNGQQIDVETGWQFDHDGAAFAVFYANNAGFSNASQIFSSTALGNSYVWKSAPFRGDLAEILSLLEVTV